jgi:hypothetical protein
MAFKKGLPLDGPPTNRADVAKKVAQALRICDFGSDSFF